MYDNKRAGPLNFVTSNGHKFSELSKIFARSGIEIQWTRNTYEEIQADNTSLISLDSAKKISGKIGGRFFLEDTGLYIDSVSGFPGPYSSYVSKTIGNEGILRLMEGRDRTASFTTVITYYDCRDYHQFEGVLHGKISLQSRGENGFGYDPIFVPDGYGITLAEMDTDLKSELSHRGIAARKFIEFLTSAK